MISTVFLSTILVATISLIQTTWMKDLSILGARPDLSMLALSWLAFSNEEAEGTISGFLVGLAEDAIAAVPFGYHAFSRTLTAFVSSLTHGSFHMDSLVLPMVFGVTATMLKAVSGFGLYFLFGSDGFLYNPAEPSLWIEIGMNALLAPVVFFLLSKASPYLVTRRRVHGA